MKIIFSIAVNLLQRYVLLFDVMGNFLQYISIIFLVLRVNCEK